MAAKGWNQRKLSEASGVRPNTLSDLLNGSNSQVETLTALATALDVPLWALFCGEHEYALFSERAKQENTAQLRRDEVKAAVQAEVAPLLEAIVAKLSGETVAPVLPVLAKPRRAVKVR